MVDKMIMTAVDTCYTFDELEEYAKEGILYDIMSKLDISEEEAIQIAEDKTYQYLTTINYKI